MKVTSKLITLILLTNLLLFSNILTTVAAEGWTKNSRGWRYQLSEDVYVRSEWRLIGGKYYYFDRSNYMLSNAWLTDSKKNSYFLTADGSMATGWVQDNGYWYYTNSSGAMVTGWLQYKNNWYYLNNDGSMETERLLTANKVYYFNSSGVWIK
jgi:FOG: Glucan-binding domain (YG repeat)